MIYKFIGDVCKILNISAPKVSFDTSNFTTPTMMAQCSPDGSEIYLRQCSKPDTDQFFSTAHELRHVWQMRNDYQAYFKQYKPVDQCTDLEEYNLQLAEVDANAFAAVIMADFFRLDPLFGGLSDAVKTQIRERIPRVLETLETQRRD